MDFPCSRSELNRISGISRSATYELQARKVLTPPSLWCGRKVFCLRRALSELCQVNGLELPSDAAIALHWKMILDHRCKR
jgi:hypothetical protein